MDAETYLKAEHPEPKSLPEKLICDAGNVEAMTVNAIIDYLESSCGKQRGLSAWWRWDWR